LDWALKDADAQAALLDPRREGDVVSVVLHVNVYPGASFEPLRGSLYDTVTHARLLVDALVRSRVRCQVEVRDAGNRVLLVHVKDSAGVQAFTRWVVKGLPSQRVAIRRLRRVLSAAGTEIRPWGDLDRIKVGAMSCDDAARLAQIVDGAVEIRADELADMDPDELEAVAVCLSGDLRAATGVFLLISAQPGCVHEPNRLEPGSFRVQDALRLASYLEARQAPDVLERTP
jgi:hypothetical protein